VGVGQAGGVKALGAGDFQSPDVDGEVRCKSVTCVTCVTFRLCDFLAFALVSA
jgi:hypothetical protein